MCGALYDLLAASTYNPLLSKIASISLELQWARRAQNKNSITFSSAPRREAVSQLDRPAVSQTKTHTLGFLSVADTAPSSGEYEWCQNRQWPNGNVGGRRHFDRRFEPWYGQHGSGVAAVNHPPGFEPPTRKSAGGCVTIRPKVNTTQMCLQLLGAFSAKTFDPPPPHPDPPLKKCYPVLGDRGLGITKSIGGWSYWAK